MTDNPPAFYAHAVRGIIFDLDGTLIDSYAAIAESLNHARASFRLAPLPETAVRRLVGHGLESLIASQVTRDQVPEGVRLFRERYAAVYGERTRLLPGVRDGLQRLAERGYGLAVASNKPARFGEALIRQFGLAPYIRCVLGPDRVGSTKPDPTMLRGCLQALGLGPRRGLYVGDMTLDVESAARADMPVVLVCGGSSTADELRATGQIVVERFDDLVGLLRGADAPTTPSST